jgi:hypothetical protein
MRRLIPMSPTGPRKKVSADLPPTWFNEQRSQLLVQQHASISVLALIRSCRSTDRVQQRDRRRRALEFDRRALIAEPCAGLARIQALSQLAFSRAPAVQRPARLPKCKQTVNPARPP